VFLIAVFIQYNKKIVKNQFVASFEGD